jgi:8-oxo-dGTP diphosphatase
MRERSATLLTAIAPLDDREAQEELSMQAELMFDAPLFVTVTRTKGKAPHTDVSRWYVVTGDRTAPITFDTREYRDLRWFAFDALPSAEQTDPELARFCHKLHATMEVA